VVAAALTPAAFTLSVLLATFTTTTPAGNGNWGIDRVRRELIEDALFHMFQLCYGNVTRL
jgi:hypothetical protein